MGTELMVDPEEQYTYMGMDLELIHRLISKYITRHFISTLLAIKVVRYLIIFMATVTGTRASFNFNYITQPFTVTWLNTAMEEQYTSMHNPACIITIIGGNCQ